MKLPSLIATLLAALFVFAVSPVFAKEPPPFPGQPKMNVALKHLKAAQAQAPKDTSAALASLQEAATALSKAAHNKGTYVPIARQLVEQATQYLQHNEVDKALHKIDEAIAAVDRGGETHERY